MEFYCFVSCLFRCARQSYQVFASWMVWCYLSCLFCRCFWNDFIIFKHSLSESFKLQLGIFLIIESPTIATVCNDCNDCNSFPVDFTPFMWSGWWRKLPLGCFLPLLLLTELSRALDWFSFDSLTASWLLTPDLLLLLPCIWIDLSIELIFFFYPWEEEPMFLQKIWSNLWLLVVTMLLQERFCIFFESVCMAY